MGKTHESKNTQELARLFERISKGEDPKLLRKEATRLMSNVEPSDITLAEQNLIEHGYPAHLVQQLSAAFMLMGIIEEQGVNLKNKLEPNHILRLIIAEHDLLRCFISDLEDTSKAIHHSNRLTDTCSEFRKLCHIIEHLDAMEEHIEREEDVIFPYLKKMSQETGQYCFRDRGNSASLNSVKSLQVKNQQYQLKPFPLRMKIRLDIMNQITSKHQFL